MITTQDRWRMSGRVYFRCPSSMPNSSIFGERVSDDNVGSGQTLLPRSQQITQSCLPSRIPPARTFHGGTTFRRDTAIPEQAGHQQELGRAHLRNRLRRPRPWSQVEEAAPFFFSFSFSFSLPLTADSLLFTAACTHAS